MYNGAAVPMLVSKDHPDVSPLYTTIKEFSQRKFMLTINGKLKEDIFMEANHKKKIILTGRCCKGSSYWLTSPPNREFNTVVESAEYRAWVKYSMG
jgi:hypothetical protein